MIFLEKQRSNPGPKNPYNPIESMVYLSTLMVWHPCMDPLGPLWLMIFFLFASWSPDGLWHCIWADVFECFFGTWLSREANQRTKITKTSKIKVRSFRIWHIYIDRYTYIYIYIYIQKISGHVRKIPFYKPPCFGHYIYIYISILFVFVCRIYIMYSTHANNHIQIL